MWIAVRQSVCALGVSAALVTGAVSAPLPVAPLAQAVHVVHLSDVTLTAVSSTSAASAVTLAGLVLVPLVKTITFVELWAIVAVDIVAAPVLAPLFWFSAAMIGWAPRDPVDAITRYLDGIAQDLVRAIRYPFTGVIETAATGNRVQSSPAASSRKPPAMIPASEDPDRRTLPGPGVGKGHSALAVRTGASAPTAKHADTHKTEAGSTPGQRSGRAHGARVHANSRNN